MLNLLLIKAQPKKICSRVGLCAFDGARGVSAGIKSVVDENNGDNLADGLSDAMWSACEMTVVWMQNQLKQNQTQDRLLSYINDLCDRLPSPNGQSAVGCGSLSSMPQVSLTIGGKQFDLSPEEAAAELWCC